MIKNQEYCFPVSISRENFEDKIITNAMIGTSKDEKNREIRKEYGFSPNRGIGFERVNLTPQALLESLLSGKVFCHLFNPQSTRKDGTFGSSEKKDENFDGSYVIGVDVDKTSYTSPEEYISTLTLQPTFYYTSYSNQQEGKGARFRLIYVFNSRIIADPIYFRYVAWELNRVIEKDTGEGLEDDCNLRCSQYFNGTNKNYPGIKLSYGNNNLIYDLKDIGISEEGYVDFLRHKGYYKTLTSDKKDYITRYLSMYDFIEKKEVRGIQHTIVNDKRGTLDEERKCSPRLIEDMKKMSYDEFMKYNRHKFTYSYRKEGSEWIDGIYQIVGDDYFSLYWNSKKVRDGEKRRKKMFERICLRRVMNPNITADTLLFNAYEDRYRFFEIDQDLSIDCLVKNVERALEMDVLEIEEMYSSNLQYLREKSGKSGIIFKSGAYENKADLKAVNWSIISEIYDPNKTVKENLKIVRKKVKIKERTLYRFCKEKGIKPDKNKITDEELEMMLDINLSIRENLKSLKEQGIKISMKRIQKFLKEMRND